MADVCKYGEPSVSSRTNTPEFDAGYEAAFGPSKDEIRAPKRTRYVYRGGKCIEVGGPDDFGPEEGDDARLHVVNDLYMVGTTMPGPNGPIDIGSRAKRREYMTHDPFRGGERRELSDMSDWSESWKRAEQQREAIRNGTYRSEERRYQIGKVAYELSKKDRR